MRQYRSRPLMTRRYSAPERWAKSGLVYMCSPFPAFFSPHKIAIRRTTPENRPFCHSPRPKAPPHRAIIFSGKASKPCKKQPRGAPIRAAAGRKGASLPPRPAPFKAVLARTRAYTRAPACSKLAYIRQPAILRNLVAMLIRILYKYTRRKIFPHRFGKFFRTDRKIFPYPPENFSARKIFPLVFP